MRSCDTMTKHLIPQLTLYRCITQKDDQVTTLHTPWTIARNSYAHARFHLCMVTVPNSGVEMLNI